MVFVGSVTYVCHTSNDLCNAGPGGMDDPPLIAGYGFPKGELIGPPPRCRDISRLPKINNLNITSEMPALNDGPQLRAISE